MDLVTATTGHPPQGAPIDPGQMVKGSTSGYPDKWFMDRASYPASAPALFMPPFLPPASFPASVTHPSF